jgi:hypothetical protein
MQWVPPPPPEAVSALHMIIPVFLHACMTGPTVWLPIWMSNFERVNDEDLSGNIFNGSQVQAYFLQCQSTVESFKYLSEFVLHFTVNSRVILIT